MIAFWLITLAPRASARRRVQALGTGAGGSAPAGLERWLEQLCLPFDRLPFDAASVARAAPPAVLCFLLVVMLVAGPPSALVAAVALAGGAGILRNGAPRRRGVAVDRELPEVLEAVARHLRAGGSLAQAIVAATPTGSSPLATSWTRLAADLELVGVLGALERWMNRSGRHIRPTERLAASALALSAESGGSPARAVDGVAATLRSRLAVAGEIRALSSQARSSAAVIAAAPLAFALLAAATDGRTITFFRSTAGVGTLAAGLFLDGVGAWWMASLCRVTER